MQTGGGLKVHTSLPPEGQAAQSPKDKPTERVRWRVRPRGSGVRAIHARRPRIRQKNYVKRKTTFSERLLRDTAVACALILTVMAFQNLDTPFTNRVTATVKNLISMDMHLDETLGKLSFVQRLMPESALVFLNMSPSSRALPVDGKTAHTWSEAQPWLEYETKDGADVCAILDGTLAACAQSESGDWTLLVNHDDGSQAVYAYLANTAVRAGENVKKGDKLGEAGAGADARVYFEYRVNAIPSDPTALLQEAVD